MGLELGGHPLRHLVPWEKEPAVRVKRALRLVTLMVCGQLSCGAQQIKKPPQLSPQEAFALRLAITEELIASEDYDNALSYLQSILNRGNRKNPRLRYFLGIILREKGMLDAAAQEFKFVIKAAPHHASAYDAYGVVLDKQLQHRQAEAQYRKALKLAPDQAEYHNNLGFCLFLQRRLPEAKDHLAEAIHLDPSFRRAFNNLGFVLGLMKQPKEAYRYFYQVGGEIVAYTNLGIVEEYLGRPQQARQYYQKALSLRHDFPAALRNLKLLEKEANKSKEGNKGGELEDLDEVGPDGEVNEGDVSDGGGEAGDNDPKAPADK
jgi:Flp pilus assembly protein TadD